MLNGEEKHAHAAWLKEQEQADKRITYSEGAIDKMFEQRNSIERECRKLQLDQQKEKDFTNNVLKIMGWRL